MTHYNARPNWLILAPANNTELRQQTTDAQDAPPTA